MLSLARRRVLGVLVIIGVIGAVAIGISRPNPLEQVTVYEAEFDSVQGLGAIDRDIRVAGVNAGRIGEVRREGDDAVVELILTEDVPIHTDARAKLRPHTLFEGSDFIDLSPGSPSAPLLEEGGTIPIEQTQVYVSLDQALRVLREPIRERLRNLAEVGARTLKARAVVGIQRTLRNSPPLMRHLAPAAHAAQGPGGEELAGAIDGLARTSTALAVSERHLAALPARTERTLAALTIDGSEPLDAAVLSLPGTLEELGRAAPKLSRVVGELDRLAVAATPALPDLTIATREARPLLRDSIPVLQRATPLIADLRTLAERFTRAAPTMTRLMRKLAPPSRIFAGSVLPAMHADSRLGPPVYEQLFSAFAAAAGTVRPYQTLAQNPNGAGHLVRLGGYVDRESGGFTSTALRCATVRETSPRAAREMRLIGGCE
jgi:phospholipid/cholesterol/gamma-HCH transport system substrate-binding protein